MSTVSQLGKAQSVHGQSQANRIFMKVKSVLNKPASMQIFNDGKQF